MTAEQLQTVRAERWRHIANPLLTADDARAWLDAAGLCLFLPRRQQFLAPAPSFVEACAGAPSETPSREAIDNAAGLMHRLVADGSIIPLNLFGTPSETPDFLASREAFPHLFSLRGTRDWKTAPAGKSSPLVIEIWKLLEKEGALTAVEIQSALGRELTEAAVLRGLMDLWSNLRVLPEFAGGAPTHWSLTQLRFKDALNAATKLSQTTALSALVSLYLESVIAATSEEIETFLSPLTSRSRVRETVNGLSATRQLTMLPVGTQSMFHITGALPEFAEPEVVAKPDAEETPAVRTPRVFDRERKPAERKTFVRKTGERKTGERKPYERKTAGRPAFGKKPFDKAARPFRPAARPAAGEQPAPGERPAFRRAPNGGAGGKFPPKRSGFAKGPGFAKGAGFKDRGDRPARPFPRAEGPGGDAKPTGERTFRPRRETSTDRPSSFRPRRDDAGKRPGSFAAKRSFAAGGSSRPKKFGGAAPGKPAFRKPGFSKPGFSKPGLEHRPSKPGVEKPGFDKPRFAKPGFDKPRAGKPSFGKAPFGKSKPGGFKSTGRDFGKSTFGSKPPSGRSGFGDKSKPGEKRPFFRKREEGAGRPASSSRPPFKRTGSGARSGARPGARPGGGSFAGERESFGDRKFAGPPKKFGSAKKFGAGKSFGGAKKFGGAGKSFGGAGKSFGAGGKSRGPGDFKARKPGGKPGGSRPPFRKRKDEGGTKAE